MIGANPRTISAVNLALSARLLVDLERIKTIGADHLECWKAKDFEKAQEFRTQALALDARLSNEEIYRCPIAGQA